MEWVKKLHNSICIRRECDQFSYKILESYFGVICKSLFPREFRVDVGDVMHEWLTVLFSHPYKRVQICEKYHPDQSGFISYLKAAIRNSIISYCSKEFKRRKMEDIMESFVHNDYLQRDNLLEDLVAEKRPNPEESYLYESSSKFIDKIIRTLPENRLRAFLNWLRDDNRDDRKIFLENETMDNIYQLTKRMKVALCNEFDANQVSKDDFLYYLCSEYPVILRNEYLSTIEQREEA